MLSDTKARQAKPQPNPYKLADRDGLYLHVLPTGGKAWRYEYRLAGKRETVTLGRYPDVPLVKARQRLQEARALLADGISPAGQKQADKAAQRAEARNTFKALADDWSSEKGPTRSKSWQIAVGGRLSNHINPVIGAKPVNAVTADDVLSIMYAKRDEGRPALGEACRRDVAMILRWGMVNRRAKLNVARELAGALTVPASKSHRPLARDEVPTFRERVEAYDSPMKLDGTKKDHAGRTETKLAMRLLLLTFVRKNELIRAPWSEIDLDAAEWRIPAYRMKGKREHIVPLSRQAVATFRELKSLSSGSKYVIPHYSDTFRPGNGQTINAAFVTMGYKIGDFVPHGLRATASTFLHELGYRPDIVEMQMAHKERNRIAGVYNKAEYLTERRQMMQDYADFILAVAVGDNIVSLHEARRKKEAQAAQR
jgi:integrase